MRSVMTLLQALVNSNGTMAQFNHPELSQVLTQQPFVPFPASFQSQSQGAGQQQGGYVGAGSVSPTFSTRAVKRRFLGDAGAEL
jgi:hypothetical protein